MNGNGEIELPEASAEELAYQAKELQRFLEHPAWHRAIMATEQAIITTWTKAQDPLGREMCWHELHAFRRLQTHLRAVSQRKPQLEP